MKKRIHFASRRGEGWPATKELEHYFLAPARQRWFFERGNDSAAFWGEGADGTEHLTLGKGRVDIELMMWGNPILGVLMIYSKWGGPYRQMFSSKGDLSRLREWVHSIQGTPLPVGLFVPFEVAWKAVKEFIETNGELPKSIEWIANDDLPPDTFPDP
jgi:hypothetical protein